MINKFINISTISSIRIYDKEEYLKEPWFYKIHSKGDHKQCSFLGIHLYTKKETYSEDVFENFIGDFMSRSKFNEKELKSLDKDEYFIEDGILYRKPYIKLKMINGEEHLIYLDTLEDINKFIKENNLDIDKKNICKLK